MKNYIIILLLIIVSCKTIKEDVTINEQTDNSKQTEIISVVYGYKSLNTEPDNLQHNFTKEQIDMAKNVINTFENIEFELMCNKKQSSYQIIDKLNLKDDVTYKVASITAGKNKIYFNDLINNKVFYEKELDNKKFYIEEEPSKTKWQLTNESKKIDDYTCYKAHYPKTVTSTRTGKTTQTNVIVWFTPEIPYSFGPMGLSGLPGLILEASLTDGKTIYYVKSISSSNKSILNFPKDIITISKSEFEKIYTKNKLQNQ